VSSNNCQQQTWQIERLNREKEKCLVENSDIKTKLRTSQSDLRKCKIDLTNLEQEVEYHQKEVGKFQQKRRYYDDRSEYIEYIPKRKELPVPAPFGSDEKLKSPNFSPSSEESDLRLVLGNGNVMEQMFQLLLFPVTLSNRKAPIWRNNAPIWPVRMVIVLVACAAWFFVAYVIFRVTMYALDSLPVPESRKTTEKSEKKLFFYWGDRSKTEKKSQIEGVEFDPIALFSDLFKRLPVGAISESNQEEILRSIDPVFLMIHLEKLRRKISLERLKSEKVLQSIKLPRIKLPRKSPFLAYLALAIVTIGSRFEVRTVVPLIQTIPRISSLKEL